MKKDMRASSLRAAAATVALGTLAAQGATKYWDTLAGSGNGVGGSGTLTAQTTTFYSNAATGDATLSSAAATDDGIFAGTAGTVTFGAAYALNTATFNTTNYALTTSSTTARIFNAPITLAANVNLNLINNSTDSTLGIASVTGGSGSTLTINGGQTGTASARVNIAVASSTISTPTTISGAGTALAGYVATATGANITNTITNNSNFTTLLGATSGNDLTLSSAAIVSGSSGVQFSAGTSGGAGTITLNSANTYSGPTLFNGALSGVVKLGVDNALPTATAVVMGSTSTNGQKLDLNGHAQTIASLASNGGTGLITSNATGTATDTLIINGSATTNYRLYIADGTTRKVGLTLASANIGTLTLSGADAYSGGTTVNGGTLIATSGAGSNAAGTAASSSNTVTLASTAGLAVGQTVSGTGIAAGTKVTGITSSTVISISANTTAALSSTALTFGAYDSLGSGAVSVSGGTLGLNGSSHTVGTVTASGGTIQNGVLNGTSYDLRAGTISAVLAGASAATKSTGGTENLSNANLYSGGTTVTAGTLVTANTTALGVGGGVTINGGTLDLNGSAVTPLSLGAGGTFSLSSGKLALTLSNSQTFDNITSSAAGFTITGGTFDLTNSVTNYNATYNVLNGFTSGSVSGLSFTNYNSANYTASLSNAGVLSFAAVAVPEPAILSVIGVIGITALRRRRQQV